MVYFSEIVACIKIYLLSFPSMFLAYSRLFYMYSMSGFSILVLIHMVGCLQVTPSHGGRSEVCSPTSHTQTPNWSPSKTPCSDNRANRSVPSRTKVSLSTRCTHGQGHTARPVEVYCIVVCACKTTNACIFWYCDIKSTRI